MTDWADQQAREWLAERHWLSGEQKNMLVGPLARLLRDEPSIRAAGRSVALVIAKRIEERMEFALNHLPKGLENREQFVSELRRAYRDARGAAMLEAHRLLGAQ